jgi:hypothetical protein
MTDPNAQLTLLRAQRDTTTDPALRAALDAAIAALEATTPPPSQTIHNEAPNQGVQGIVQGPITLNQQQTTLNQQGQTQKAQQGSPITTGSGHTVTQAGGDTGAM